MFPEIGQLVPGVKEEFHFQVPQMTSMSLGVNQQFTDPIVLSVGTVDVGFVPKLPLGS